MNPEDMTYSELLESRGYAVKNISKAGAMLNEVFAFIEEDVISYYPDLVIVNFGIVEVSYRRTLRWFNNQAIENYYLNRVFARPYVFKTPLAVIYNFLLRSLNYATRSVASLLGFRWQWLSTKRFLAVLEAMIRVILKETNSHVIVIGINPCSDRVESILRGSSEKIKEANTRIKLLCEDLGQRTRFLSPDSFINEDNINALVPDGIHYSAQGHQALFQRIVQQIDCLFSEITLSVH
jgi:lysophospholipase L1-like esterase